VMTGLAKEMGKAVTGRLNNGLPQVPPAKLSSELSVFQQALPIYQMKDVIIKAINDNRVLMISGETGSGKTTQACCLRYLVLSLTIVNNNNNDNSNNDVYLRYGDDAGNTVEENSSVFSRIRMH